MTCFFFEEHYIPFSLTTMYNNLIGSHGNSHDMSIYHDTQNISIRFNFVSIQRYSLKAIRYADMRCINILLHL